MNCCIRVGSSKKKNATFEGSDIHLTTSFEEFEQYMLKSMLFGLSLKTVASHLCYILRKMHCRRI